jgi:hypothetical protein
MELGTFSDDMSRWFSLYVRECLGGFERERLASSGKFSFVSENFFEKETQSPIDG